MHEGVSGGANESMVTNGTYSSGKRIQNVTAENGRVVRLEQAGPNLQITIEQPEKSSAASIKELLARRKQHQFGQTSAADQPVRTDLDVIKTDIRDTMPPKTNPDPLDNGLA